MTFVLGIPALALMIGLLFLIPSRARVVAIVGTFGLFLVFLFLLHFGLSVDFWLSVKLSIVFSLVVLLALLGIAVQWLA